MATTPGNWCGIVTTLTSANGPVAGNLPGAPNPTIAEFSASFAVTIDPTASTNGIAGKYVIALSGNVASLTETGHGVASTSGFINLGATSAGIWGGYSTASEANLLGWVGSTNTLSVGSSDVAAYQLIANTSAKWRIGGNDRLVVNATLATLLSPDGDSAATVADGLVDFDSDVLVRMRVASNDRITATTTTSSLISPDAGTKVEVVDGAINLTADAQSTVGAAGGASALPATPSGYVEITINGTPYVMPFYAPS